MNSEKLVSTSKSFNRIHLSHSANDEKNGKIVYETLLSMKSNPDEVSTAPTGTDNPNLSPKLNLDPSAITQSTVVPDPKSATEIKKDTKEKSAQIISYDFNEADQARVMRKIGDIAKTFDRSSTSTLSMNAFDPISLAPAEFREALKKTFRLQLTPRELGALMSHFDPTGEGIVKCRHFLVKFTQLGAELRSQERSKTISNQKLSEKSFEEKRIRKIELLQSKNEFNIEDIATTTTDLETANEKIQIAALKYDRSQNLPGVIEKFQSSTMKPIEFKNAIEVIFNINFNKEELVAYILDFNKGNSESEAESYEIIGADFLIKFYRIIHEEREKRRQKVLESKRKLQKEQHDHELKFIELSQKKDIKVDWEYTDEDYISGMSKITEIAQKYDKTLSSSVNLQLFEILSMDYIQFYEALKRTFSIQLLPKELGAIIKKFDKNNNNLLDSKEFILMFLKIGTEYRLKLHTIQMLKNKENEEKKKLFSLQKSHEIELRMQANIDQNFTDEDVQSMLTKLHEHAYRYDKNAPGASSLISFYDGATLTPGIFRDLLRRTFNFVLTSKEFGALLHHFKTITNTNTNTNSTSAGSTITSDNNNNINSKDFISIFLRIGMEERFKRRQEIIQNDKQTEKISKDKDDQRLQLQLDKMDIKVDLDNFTDEDRVTALKKLKTVAESYEKSNPIAPNLNAFNCILTPQMFKELLRRILNVNLTPKESGALATYFSEDNNSNHSSTITSASTTNNTQPQKMIIGQKFIIAFMQMGIDGRNQNHIAKKAYQRKIAQDIEDEQRRKEKLARIKLALDIEIEYTTEDYENAFRKLTRCAFKYNTRNTNTGDEMLKGFEASYLTYLEFREKLKIIFNLHFTKKEFAAIISFYDKKRSQRINCQEFLVTFLKAGADERARDKALHLEVQRAKKEFKEQEQIRKIKRLEDKIELGLNLNDFTDEDHRSAFIKIAQAAKYYDKMHTSAPSLEAFSAAFVKPIVFKDLFRRSFDINLTTAELGAILKYFDKEKQGIIPCNEFLKYFTKISNNEKNKEYMTLLHKRKIRDKLNSRESSDRMAAYWAKLEAEIDWNFSDTHLESAILKLSSSARDYDPTSGSSSSIGMSAFEMQTMSPALFRDTIRRVFGIKLTNKEAGALSASCCKGSNTAATTSGTATSATGAAMGTGGSCSRVVECSLFLIKFTALCNNEKEKLRAQSRTHRRLLDEKILEDSFKQNNKNNINTNEDTIETSILDMNFTKEDFNSCLDKLRTSIALYDRSNPTTISMNSFNTRSMPILEFREQLKNVFRIYLNPRELGALTKIFSAEVNVEVEVESESLLNPNEVNCIAFQQYFYKVQRESRAKSRQEKLRQELLVKEKIKEDEMTKLLTQQRSDMNKLKFDVEDEKSMLKKLRKVATAFGIDSSPFIQQLQKSKDQGLTPDTFRSTFYRVFGSRVSYSEVGALMNVLDEGGMGCIDVTKFISSMYRLARMEERVSSGELLEDSLSLASLTVGGPLSQISFIDRSSSRPLTRGSLPPASTSTSIGSASTSLFTKKTLGQHWLLPQLTYSKDFNQYGNDGGNVDVDVDGEVAGDESVRPWNENDYDNESDFLPVSFQNNSVSKRAFSSTGGEFEPALLVPAPEHERGHGQWQEVGVELGEIRQRPSTTAASTSTTTSTTSNKNQDVNESKYNRSGGSSGNNNVKAIPRTLTAPALIQKKQIEIEIESNSKIKKNSKKTEFKKDKNKDFSSSSSTTPTLSPLPKQSKVKVENVISKQNEYDDDVKVEIDSEDLVKTDAPMSSPKLQHQLQSESRISNRRKSKTLEKKVSFYDDNIIANSTNTNNTASTNTPSPLSGKMTTSAEQSANNIQTLLNCSRSISASADQFEITEHTNVVPDLTDLTDLTGVTDGESNTTNNNNTNHELVSESKNKIINNNATNIEVEDEVVDGSIESRSVNLQVEPLIRVSSEDSDTTPVEVNIEDAFSKYPLFAARHDEVEVEVEVKPKKTARSSKKSLQVASRTTVPTPAARLKLKKELQSVKRKSTPLSNTESTPTLPESSTPPPQSPLPIPHRRKIKTANVEIKKNKPVFFFPALLGNAPIFTMSAADFPIDYNENQLDSSSSTYKQQRSSTPYF